MKLRGIGREGCAPREGLDKSKVKEKRTGMRSDREKKSGNRETECGFRKFNGREERGKREKEKETEPIFLGFISFRDVEGNREETRLEGRDDSARKAEM